MFTILVACTANVCRSPLAAFTLGERLSHQGTEQGFVVVSAGTQARIGQAICPRVSSQLAADDAGRRYAGLHRSRSISAALIDTADLILVPDAANRTRIALVSPLARHRTFTLREAEALLIRGPDTDAVHLSDLVPAMHHNRPFVAVEPSRPGWLRRSRRPHHVSIDILDGHTLGPRQHLRTLSEVQVCADALGEGLAVLPREVS